jgi:hypothetical protein
MSFRNLQTTLQYSLLVSYYGLINNNTNLIELLFKKRITVRIVRNKDNIRTKINRTGK